MTIPEFTPTQKNAVEQVLAAFVALPTPEAREVLNRYRAPEDHVGARVASQLKAAAQMARTKLLGGGGVLVSLDADSPGAALETLVSALKKVVPQNTLARLVEGIQFNLAAQDSADRERGEALAVFLAFLRSEVV